MIRFESRMARKKTFQLNKSATSLKDIQNFSWVSVNKELVEVVPTLSAAVDAGLTPAPNDENKLEWYIFLIFYIFIYYVFEITVSILYTYSLYIYMYYR